MRITLRSLILSSAMVAAAALTVQTASAEAFHVPFNFTVNGTALPAGRYNVNWDASMHVLTLTSADNKHIFGWVAGPGPDSTKRAVLRFDSLASGYALRDVQCHGLITGRLDKGVKSTTDSAVHVIAGE